jgi:hypothetical protein
MSPKNNFINVAILNEEIDEYKLMKFLRNAPSILYGEMNIDGKYQKGVFKLGWHKIMRSPFYKFYNAEGINYGGITIKQAYEMIESGEVCYKPIMVYKDAIDEVLEK